MTAMPTWEEFMIPVLTLLADGEPRSTRDIRREVSDRVGLTDEQRTESLPSGRVTRAADRISWALHFLNRVDALDRPRRATYAIAGRGRGLLASHPHGLTERDLKPMARPGDEWWLQKSSRGTRQDEGRDEADPPGEAIQTVLDPYEQIREGIRRVEDEVASELLSRLSDQDPAFFESAVVKLLLAMGYGGVGGRGVTTGLTHDGGIDGVIDQDVLGLTKVYIQAKRYGPQNSVQRPEVQGFVGALSGKAEGGVFITTSRFSSGAVEWVRNVPVRIILIDGQRLAELMIEYGVGVQVEAEYRIVKIDEDFFT